MQFELDPHYHLAAINIFYKALRMADANGFRSEFPKHYLDVVEKMIEAQYNLSEIPDEIPTYSTLSFIVKKDLSVSVKLKKPEEKSAKVG